MEAGFIALIVAFAVSIGIAIGRFLFKTPGNGEQKSRGVLNVNYSDLFDDPELFLVLRVPVEDIVSQKQILLDVNVIQQNSQK